MNGQRMECVPGRGKAVRPLLSVDARLIAFAQNPAAKHLAIGALLAAAAARIMPSSHGARPKLIIGYIAIPSAAVTLGTLLWQLST
jgi:hypothetical protein